MKVSINKRTILLVHPVLIVGSYDESGKPNIMAASWGGICCSEPPCIAISLRKATYTYHNIMSKQSFTINIPDEEHINEADYCGIYSGRDEDKFASLKLTPVRSLLVDAPYVEEFPIVHHCKVIKVTEIGLHTQFIGEILDTSVEQGFLNKQGLPDMEMIKPFLYDTASRNYFGVGNKKMPAYSYRKK